MPKVYTRNYREVKPLIYPNNLFQFFSADLACRLEPPNDHAPHVLELWQQCQCSQSACESNQSPLTVVFDKQYLIFQRWHERSASQMLECRQVPSDYRSCAFAFLQNKHTT